MNIENIQHINFQVIIKNPQILQILNHYLLHYYLYCNNHSINTYIEKNKSKYRNILSKFNFKNKNYSLHFKK